MKKIILIEFIVVLLSCNFFNCSAPSTTTREIPKIYELKAPEGTPYGTVKGKISDISGKPVDATLKVNNLSDHSTIGTINSNPENGNYLLELPLGKNYAMFIDKQGYFPASINIDLENKKNTSITEDIVLFTIEDLKNKDLPITINNIFFETSKAKLMPESFTELNRLANILQGIPGIKVEIAGHTDNVGRADYNLELSKKRAQAVVDYLISKGCEKFNLTAKGYGEKKPVAPNDTDENKKKNRRVEFRILK